MGFVVARRRFVAALAVLAVSAAFASGCKSVLPRQYEYDEEIQLSLDGSAVVFVNGSIPALVALRGLEHDLRPTARLDRAAIRNFFSAEGVRVSRISSSRRHGRRFVHIRLAVQDIRRLSESAGFAWATYSLAEKGQQVVFEQTVGAAVAREVGDVGWDGNEIVAFRMHLPARIQYHNAPSKQVERGNILVWEQSLAERLKGTPIDIEARMESESILYTTVTLFAAMAVVVIALFAGIIWWVVRKGRKQLDAA
jgi:hypothetical protein